MKSKTIILGFLLISIGILGQSCGRTSDPTSSPQVSSFQQTEEQKTVWTKAPQGENTESFLKRFYADSASVMNEIPAKNHYGARTRDNQNSFSQDKLQELKSAMRSTILSRVDEAKSDFRVEGMGSSDLASDLVDRPELLEVRLQALEDQNLLSAKLPEQPWSDDYWAIKEGVLGYRYADPEMVSKNTGDEKSWPILRNYIEQFPASVFIEQGKTDQLSPSEKYDLLVGDTDNSLTEHMWAEGKAYFDDQGKVESWMGICHGWAAAAYMLARPTKVVEVIGAKGTPITFYPADIKALGNLLWARNEYPTKAVGNRCDVKNPKKDSKGRLLDQGCFDTNPGTWHLTTVHQIGVVKKSFVMDATYDYEVWNQPILSYSYTYFNPQSGKTKKLLKDAVIPLEKFKKDRFKSHRSRDAVSVVGITMNVSYMAETKPTQSPTDTPQQDSITEVVYRYDLELDAQGNIIGGEWYSNAHPDFLWTPKEKTRIMTSWDRKLSGQWNATSTEPFTSTWTAFAKAASRNKGTPLAKVVESLFEASSRP
jgi:hypothetical protein